MSYDVILLTAMSKFPYVDRSLGAYKIASTLRAQGYSVFVLDYFPEFWVRNILLETLDKLISSNTLFVGFSATMFSLDGNTINPERLGEAPKRRALTSAWPLPTKDITRIIDHIRSKGVKIVYGGPSDRKAYTWDEIKHLVDYGVYGFGEDAVFDVIKDIKSSRNIIASTHNRALGKLVKVDRETPNYNFKEQVSHWSEEDLRFPSDVVGIEMARGCIFKCTFCNFELKGKHPKDDRHIRSIDSIVYELKRNYKLFGVTNYYIADDTFNDNTLKLKLIRDAIKNLDFKPTFWAYIRADFLVAFPEQIRLLAEIGVNRMNIGLETLDRESGKLVGKGGDPSKILEALKITGEVYHELGIPLNRHCNIIVGLPNDTRERVDKWIKPLIETNLYADSLTFTPLFIIPGTELEEQATSIGYRFPATPEEFREKGDWYNDYWTFREAWDYSFELAKRNIEVGVSCIESYTFNTLMSIGYTMEELLAQDAGIIINNQELLISQAREYIEEYIFRVINLLKK